MKVLRGKQMSRNLRSGAPAAAGAALLLTAPAPGTAVGTLQTATAAPDPLAPLLALVALIAWALVGWLLLVAAGSLATRLPGTAGRVAAAGTRRVAPAAVRRLVEVSLGLTVAVGALGASPAAASPQIPPPAAAATLDWPAEPPSPVPSLDWNPGSADHVAPRSHVATTPVVVRPGDSLWSVAADHLPPCASNAQIARAWPTWWAANRTAVGADPDLIHPGLPLTPPAQHSPTH
jgi:hypothetical protein